MITGSSLPPEQSPDPGPAIRAGVAPPARRACRAAVRVGRTGVLLTIAAIASFGAVVTPALGMLLYAPALGAAMACAIALVDPDFPREVSARRAVVYAAAAGVLLVPFTNGLVELGTLGGAILLVLLVVGPLVATDWVLEPPDGMAAPDLGALRELLPVLPTAQLFQEWQATGELLRSRHDATAAEARALLLDELSRRDPEGAAAWLAAGDDSPQDHIRPDRDLAG